MSGNKHGTDFFYCSYFGFNFGSFASFKFRLIMSGLKGLFGIEYFHRKIRGNKNRGKFPENAIWNEGNFNSKTKESFLPLFILRETKHPVQTNGFTKTETSREEKQKNNVISYVFPVLWIPMFSKHHF